MKRFLVFFMVITLCTSALLAHGTTEKVTTVDESWPKGQILELWVPAGAGTAQDIWCRLIAQKMETILDCTMIVKNKAGGGGWVALNEFYNKKADEKIIISTLLSQVGGGRNPSAFQKIEMWNDFKVLGSMMDDPGSIWIRGDETRFTDLESLIAFAQKNEVTANIVIIGSDDDVPIYWLNKTFGTKIIPVANTDGSAGCVANLLGGHVDIVSDNIGSHSTHIAEGDMIPLAVFSKTRNLLFPEIPTVFEILGDGIEIGNTRGLSMHKDTPDFYYNIISNAFQKALADSELKDSFLKLGYAVNYRDGKEFADMMESFALQIDSFKDWIWK